MPDPLGTAVSGERYLYYCTGRGTARFWSAPVLWRFGYHPRLRRALALPATIRPTQSGRGLPHSKTRSVGRKAARFWSAPVLWRFGYHPKFRRAIASPATTRPTQSGRGLPQSKTRSVGEGRQGLNYLKKLVAIPGGVWFKLPIPQIQSRALPSKKTKAAIVCNEFAVGWTRN